MILCHSFSTLFIFLRDCYKEEVLELIKELKNGKSSNIPGCHHLVKNCNQRLHQGTFPDEVKVRRITPIYKKDDECSLKNYITPAKFWKNI